MGRSLPLLAGLGLQAITSYLTLIIAGRLLGASRFAGLSTLYVLLASLSTGLFLPLEQEIARRRGHERETRTAERGLVRRATALGLACAVVAVAVLVAGDGLTLRLLDRNGSLLAALSVGLPGYACCFVSRGVFAGTRELRRYGVQLGAEGGFRLAGVIALAAVGSHSLALTGWLFGWAPWVALATSLLGRRRQPSGEPAAGVESVVGDGSVADGSVVTDGSVVGAELAGPVVPVVGKGAVVGAELAGPAAAEDAVAGDGPVVGDGSVVGDGPVGADDPAQPLLRPLGWLLVASVAAQLLVNAGPVVVQWLSSPDQRAQAGAFLAALVVVRVPVVLFTAVQPSFLPAMAGHAAAGRRDEYVTMIRRVLMLCAAFTLLSTAALAGLGPWALHLLFGFHGGLGAVGFLVLGVSVGLFLVSIILAQALLGRGQHRATAAGWLMGLAGLALGTTIGASPVTRASAGFMLGALCAAAAFSVLSYRELRAWPATLTGPEPQESVGRPPA